MNSRALKIFLWIACGFSATGCSHSDPREFAPVRSIVNVQATRAFSDPTGVETYWTTWDSHYQADGGQIGAYRAANEFFDQEQADGQAELFTNGQAVVITADLPGDHQPPSGSDNHKLCRFHTPDSGAEWWTFCADLSS